MEIELKQTFHKDIPRYFSVQEANLWSFEEAQAAVAEKMGPGQDAFFAGLLEQSQKVRANGGIGVALLLIFVPEAGILHLTPFGQTELLTVVDVRPNSRWKNTLVEMVASGKVL